MVIVARSGEKILIHVIESRRMSENETSALIQLLATWVIRDIEKSGSQSSNSLTSNRPILTFVQRDR